jgi:hypothetical protein
MQDKESFTSLLDDGTSLRMAETKQLERKSLASWPPERDYFPPPPNSQSRPVLHMCIFLAAVIAFVYFKFYA